MGRTELLLAATLVATSQALLLRRQEGLRKFNGSAAKSLPPEIDPMPAIHRAEQTLGNVVEDARKGPERVDTNQLVADAAPKSPPSAAKVSPNDAKDHVDHFAGQLANNFNSDAVAAGVPREFRGGSCKDVCMQCLVAAAEYPSCVCTATCVTGSDDTMCKGKKYGWSRNPSSTPSAIWQSGCNTGGTDCNTCAGDEVKQKIDKCAKESVPALCYHELSMEYSEHKTPTNYCTRGIKDEKGTPRGMSECETFIVDAPSDNGWFCYESVEACEEHVKTLRQSITEYENNIPTLDTPSIWGMVMEGGF